MNPENVSKSQKIPKLDQSIELNNDDSHVIQSYTSVTYKNSKHNEPLVARSKSQFDTLKLFNREKVNKPETKSAHKIEVGLEYIRKCSDTQQHKEDKKKKALLEGQKNCYSPCVFSDPINSHIRVRFLRTGIGPELCDFFKKFVTKCEDQRAFFFQLIMGNHFY